MRIDGNVAIVSGGASGLGRATAQALVARGAKVVLLDLASGNGKTVAAELGEAARFSPGDVASEADVQAALDLAHKAFGLLGIAINCAGIGPAGRVLRRGAEPLPLDVFRKVIDVNLFSWRQRRRQDDPHEGGLRLSELYERFRRARRSRHDDDAKP